jgi:hypothetical protein
MFTNRSQEGLAVIAVEDIGLSHSSAGDDFIHLSDLEWYRNKVKPEVLLGIHKSPEIQMIPPLV